MKIRGCEALFQVIGIKAQGTGIDEIPAEFLRLYVYDNQFVIQIYFIIRIVIMILGYRQLMKATLSYTIFKIQLYNLYENLIHY